MLDHGYEVDNDKRCRAITKKGRQCTMQALRGIDLCALHSGLAQPRNAAGFGDPGALEAFKRHGSVRTESQKRAATPSTSRGGGRDYR